MSILNAITALFKAFVVNRTSLAAENMALRHQLTVMQRSVKKRELQHLGGLHHCYTRDT